jgi:hypothetical protein
VTWLLVRSSASYAPAGVALVIAIVLLAAWAIVLDAATHGWDDLQVSIYVLTIAVIILVFVVVAAVLRGVPGTRSRRAR